MIDFLNYLCARLQAAAAPFRPHSCDVDFRSENGKACLFLTVTILETNENNIVTWNDDGNFDLALEEMMVHLNKDHSDRLPTIEGGAKC